MIFEPLYESYLKGELLLIEGGFCHWHLRKDGQLTIREIIATRKGAGTEMLNILKQATGAKSIFAKCPVNLVSNGWYSKMGFTLEGVEVTKSGNKLNLWRYSLGEHYN
jgi:hypothetical protein